MRANGGGGFQAIGYRDVLDARRSVGDGARVPSADYPDGYLGNIQSRRGDRLLKNLQERLTQRSYQRGVHKGDRIDPGDYVWPSNFNPDTSLKRQARTSLRAAPIGTPAEKLAHMGKVNALSPEDMLAISAQYEVNPNDQTQVVNVQRKEQMRGLLPAWR